MWFHKTIATVFGLGYAPKAPGTFGALGAVILLAFFKLFHINFSDSAVLIVILVSFIAGTYATQKLSSIWGEDPSRVVVDEFAGLLVSILFVPHSWINIILAFVLFRFFDIVKPLGIGHVDRKVKGALGVMLDDILAGIYSAIILNIINIYI